MTIFEILKFNRELLERLRNIGVRLEDTRYIDLFGEFNDMVGSGEKVSYAVAVLADNMVSAKGRYIAFSGISAMTAIRVQFDWYLPW